VLERRDELRNLLADGLGGAATAAEAAGELEAAVRLTRRVTALDPLAEVPYRELIRRLAAAGDRGAALVAYDRLRDRLAERLGIVPSAATRSLVDEIRSERAVELPTLALPPVVSPGARSQFVGRADELAALAGEWLRVRRGERRVVATPASLGSVRHGWPPSSARPPTRAAARCCSAGATRTGLSRTSRLSRRCDATSPNVPRSCCVISSAAS
jgi:hypothetical protein